MLYECPNPDLNDNLSMDWFVISAKKYQLNGKSIEELCEYNAEVAAQLNRTQISQTWKILMQMFNTNVRNATLSGSGNVNSITVGTITDFNDKSDPNNPSRHASGSTGRHLSGGKPIDQFNTNDTSGNEDESDLSDIIEDNKPNSPTTSLDEDDEVLNPMNFMSISDSDSHSHSVLSSRAPPNPVWPFTGLVAEMLHFYASQGDVQTSVSILIVLGDKMKTSIDVSIQQQWYQSYIDLLSRYELWSVANKVIRLCPHPYINTMNQSSTTIYTTCGVCRKALNSKVSWLCERCRTAPSNCSICHVAVTGLYVWCQGCAHGGHLQHIQEWLANNTLCPAGCGHHCEYT
ncbi:unnamed protein product, partial [Medioppia subpectinata]